MFTLTRNTQYYKALSVNIYFLLLGMWQSLLAFKNYLEARQARCASSSVLYQPPTRLKPLPTTA